MKQTKNLVGRPSEKRKDIIEEYLIKFDIEKDQKKTLSSIEEACIFVLTSNDLE
ncbi:MAG: hypothetical protein LLF98_07620 [Clostridium sp.]|uniref:hypothetical protein n=1 Tax=Clostridium sp. TaxID=1506 RepID=UPI0025C09333|nr:hypothetical protein [Clostridium sp.]MCE5221122.1 hypothetical protein [Clostridium sp.]